MRIWTSHYVVHLVFDIKNNFKLKFISYLYLLHVFRGRLNQEQTNRFEYISNLENLTLNVHIKIKQVKHEAVIMFACSEKPNH